MPNPQSKPDIDVHRFAAVLAGFDICNSSDEEALTKALVLRRMAAKARMRIVDLLELPDVKLAVDAQLGPERKESPALQQAVTHAASLQEELTERMRDVRRLAEQLRRQEERSEELGRELALARSSRTTTNAAARASRIQVPSPPHSGGTVIPGWSVQLGAVVMALVMLICSLVGNSHGGNGNGVGNSQGVSAAGIHKDGAVRSVPKRRRVHHRVPRSASADDAGQLRGVPLPDLHVQPEVR
jgi:hypothetical protein